MARSWFASTLLVIATAGAASTWQPPLPTSAFIGVSVIPFDREQVLADQTVVVRGDRIERIGPTATTDVPDGSLRIDGSGRFLMPALAEMHAHVPGGKASEAEVERVLTLYAVNGIGTIRGMLGEPRHLALRRRIDRGELFSPALYTSGPSVNGTSAPSPELAVQMVVDQRKAGFDFLKIHPGLSRETFDALAAKAKELSMRFAGHVPADVGVTRALAARYATIDHLDGYLEAMLPPRAAEQAATSTWFGLNLIKDVDQARLPALVAATKLAGTWMVPTQVLLESSVSDDLPEAMAAWPEMRYVPRAQLDQWMATKRKFLEGFSAADRQRFIELRRTLIARLHRGGVKFLLGSDAPQVWNVPGFSIHRELATLVAAGMSPYDALATGTRNVAEFWGTLSTRGTVEAGRRADLVLLERNPLVHIEDTRTILGVMIAGRWSTRADLDARLNAIAASVNATPVALER